VGHAATVLIFCPQLYQLLPAGSATAAASLAAHAERAVPLRAALGQLLWLLWHSQALVMALNGGGPLTNPFRHFLQASGRAAGAALLCAALGFVSVAVADTSCFCTLSACA